MYISCTSNHTAQTDDFDHKPHQKFEKKYYIYEIFLSKKRYFIHLKNWKINPILYTQKSLSNGEISQVIPSKKKLQIVSQNESHTSIVMPCSNSVIDESGNVFRIEGPYDLNCS
jgi:hypothetical protein